MQRCTRSNTVPPWGRSMQRREINGHIVNKRCRDPTARYQRIETQIVCI
jgi:hypothetical protein